MTEDQIKHMVDRFLGWKLPDNFSPDAGISFKADYNEHTAYPAKHVPSGTNLFDATQADAMVRYMIEGMPALSAPRVEPVADETRRQWIIALIRSEFDPKPAHYKPGDEWDDGAEAIADAILAAAPSQPDTERDDHCGYCSGPIARICEFHGCQLKSTSPPSSQLDTDPATVEGLKPTERWEVGKNGWDADCEATREDI